MPSPLRRSDMYIMCVTSPRTGDMLYVGTDRSELRVYNTNTGQLKMTSDLDLGPIGHMLLSRSGRYIIAAGDRKVHVEDLHCKWSSLI